MGENERVLAEASSPETTPGPAVRRAGGAATFWASAYLLYLAVYAGALLATTSAGAWDSLFLALANSLPEALAAPLVLRLASWRERRPAPRAILAICWLLAAPVFVAWSVVASAFGDAIVDSLRHGGWSFSLGSPNLPWKALLSLLVFVAIAGFGVAGSRTREVRRAEARTERAETLRAEARLAALRAQLNPHFILNVLHSLVGLAERDPALTARALERLGTTLRYALRVQRSAVDTVPLRDELAFTLDYLELERLRLGDRLETRLAISDSLLDRPIPAFVLQPLVENSVRHAIAPRARGGVVAITAEETAGALALTVEDDGAPRPAPDAPWRDDGGVGLRLLRDRLDALYGPAATLELGRSPLGGLRVAIRLQEVD
jgi:Histidine kinase